MTSTWIITTTPQISALLDLAHRASPTVTAVAVGDVAVRGADSVISVPLPDGTPAEALAPAVAEVVAAAPGDLVLAADRAAELYPEVEQKTSEHNAFCPDGNGAVFRYKEQDLWCVAQDNGRFVIAFPDKTRWTVSPIKEEE